MLMTTFLVLGIILTAIGIWPFGFIAIGIGVYIQRKNADTSREEPTAEREDICEFDIYRQAADIEKNLKEDRY